MKKILLASIIISTLLLSGCFTKKEEEKIEAKPRKGTSVTVTNELETK